MGRRWQANRGNTDRYGILVYGLVEMLRVISTSLVLIQEWSGQDVPEETHHLKPMVHNCFDIFGDFLGM